MACTWLFGNAGREGDMGSRARTQLQIKNTPQIHHISPHFVEECPNSDQVEAIYNI